MSDILITIDCGEETCGNCEMQDRDRNYCEVFQEFIDDRTDFRLGECLVAQEYAEHLQEGEDE